jgi:hypothetical protein
MHFSRRDQDPGRTAQAPEVQIEFWRQHEALPKWLPGHSTMQSWNAKDGAVLRGAHTLHLPLAKHRDGSNGRSTKLGTLLRRSLKRRAYLFGPTYCARQRGAQRLSL